MKRWVARWGPAAIYMVLIFVASSLPDAPLPDGISDKTAHFVAYAVLGVLTYRGFAGAAWQGVTSVAGARAWLLSATYGFTDEVHQTFVSGRAAALDDWMADAAGAAVAVIALRVVAYVRAARARAV